MTKTRDMLSVEEHKKAEEERKQAFRVDIADVGNDCISIKSPIIITRQQYNLIEKICDLTGVTIQQYIKEALLQTIQIDLENPQCMGQTICKLLREEWDPIKPK